MQVEPRLAGGNAEREPSEQESLDYFREATKAPFLAAGGFDRAAGAKKVQSGKADAVVYGECRDVCPTRSNAARRKHVCLLQARTDGPLNTVFFWVL